MSQSTQRTFFIWPTLAVVSSVNLLLFGAGWWILGGSALTAPTHGGFHVWSFGVLTEVSHGAWLYSIYHTLVTILLLPLGVAGTLMTWVNYCWPMRRRLPFSDNLSCAPHENR